MKKYSKYFIFFAASIISLVLFTVSAYAVDRPTKDGAVTAELLYAHTGNAQADEVFNRFVDEVVKLSNSSDGKSVGVWKNLSDFSHSAITAIEFGLRETCNNPALISRFEELPPEALYLWEETYTWLCGRMLYEVEIFDTWESLQAYMWQDDEYDGCRLNAAIRCCYYSLSDFQSIVDALNGVLRYSFDYFKQYNTVYCYYTGEGWDMLMDNDYAAYWDGVDESKVSTIAAEQTTAANDGAASIKSTEVSGSTTTAKVVAGSTTTATTKASEQNSHIGLIVVLCVIALAVIVGIGYLARTKKKK